MIERAPSSQRHTSSAVFQKISSGFDMPTNTGADAAADVFLYCQLITRASLMRRHAQLVAAGAESPLFPMAEKWEDLNPCGLLDFGYYIAQRLGVERASQASMAFLTKDWGFVDQLLRDLQ